MTGAGRLEPRLRVWGWAGFAVIGASYLAALIVLGAVWQRQAKTVTDELERYTRTEALVLSRLLLFDLSTDPRVAEAHRIEVLLSSLGTAPSRTIPSDLVPFVRQNLDWPDAELWKRAKAAGLPVSLEDVTWARRTVYTDLLDSLLQGVKEDLSARVTFSDNLRGVRLSSVYGDVIQVGEPIGPEAGDGRQVIQSLPGNRLLVALPLTVQSNRWGMAYLLLDRGILFRLTQTLLGTLRGGLWTLVILLILFAAAWGTWWGMLLVRVRVQVVAPIVALARRMEGDESGAFAQPPGQSEPEWLSSAFDRLMERLAAQREQLLRAQRLGLMERVGAGLSHEINNALNPARLRLDELAMGGRAPGVEDVRVLREYLDHAQRVLKDLTFAVRSPDTPPRAVKPEEWVPVARRLAEAGFRGGETVEWRISEAGPVVMGDPQWLVQIAVNLVMNARDAVAGKGALGRVEVDLGQEGPDAVLQVMDNGPGIEPAVAEHVFEPFVTSKAKGSGLGLFVVDHLVRRMGGKVSLGIVPDGWTRAEVRLPAIEGETHGGI